MQIYADKLAAHLKQDLACAYLIAGDDTLLCRDASDAIRAKAISAGFDTVEITTQDSSFDWQAWLASGSEMSLFGDRRLLELRLNTSAIGTEGSKTLCAYLENPAPDAILLVTAPRLSGKPKWVGEFTKRGVFIPIYPLDADALPRWLANRATQHGLRLQRDAAMLIAEKIEGNLLAAVQELEKLALLHGTGDINNPSDISLEQAAEAVGDSARFSAFNMLDHALAGNARAACRALQHLVSEGSEPVEITGALGFELRRIASLLESKAKNQLAQAIKSMGGPMKKREIYQRALPRLQEDDIARCTMLASRADLLGKTGNRTAAYTAIEMLLLRLAGSPLLNESSILDTSH